MKHKNAFLDFGRRFVVPFGVTVAKGKFFVPIRVRFQKTRLGTEQIDAARQPPRIIEGSRDVGVGQAIRAMPQHGGRQRNDAVRLFEVSLRAKCQPGDIHGHVAQRMSVARIPRFP